MCPSLRLQLLPIRIENLTLAAKPNVREAARGHLRWARHRTQRWRFESVRTGEFPCLVGKCCVAVLCREQGVHKPVMSG